MKIIGFSNWLCTYFWLFYALVYTLWKVKIYIALKLKKCLHLRLSFPNTYFSLIIASSGIFAIELQTRESLMLNYLFLYILDLVVWRVPASEPLQPCWPLVQSLLSPLLPWRLHCQDDNHHHQHWEVGQGLAGGSVQLLSGCQPPS